LTCISLGLSAQHQKKNFRELSAKERAEKMTDRMSEELKLTEDQKNQVAGLVLENATRQEELLQKRKVEFEAQKEFRMRQENKIAAILTEEQKMIWEQRKEKLGQRAKGQAADEPKQYTRRRPRFQRGQ